MLCNLETISRTVTDAILGLEAGAAAGDDESGMTGT